MKKKQKFIGTSVMQYSFIFIVILNFIACNQSQNEIADRVIIAGRLENTNETFAIIKWDEYGFASQKEKIDRRGNFKFEIQTDKSNYYTFQYGRKSLQLYLDAGDSIYIHANTTDFLVSVQFFGDKAKENYFLKAKSLHIKKQSLNIDSIFSLKTHHFVQEADRILQKNQEWLIKYCSNTKNLDQKFVEIEKTQFLYNWAYWRLLYPDYYKHLTQLEFTDEEESYNTYLQKLDFNNSGLLLSESFRNYIIHYIRNEADLIQRRDNKAVTHLYFDLIDERISNQSIKDFCYFRFMESQLEDNPAASEQIVARFDGLCMDVQMRKLIHEDYKEYKKIEVGQKAPKISLLDKSGKRYDLEDFKGKYLYVDVWASWCGPCLQEYTLLKEIKKELEGKNIEIIAVSVDDDESKWIKMVDKKKMDGWQFIAEGGWNSSLINQFKIKRIPRFILIDPEGKIINATAPKPSENVIDLFRELNIK